MTVYSSRLSPTANTTGTSGANATYATVRASTAATSTSGTTAITGQTFATPNYTVGQVFLTFNTSAIPASQRYAILSINATAAGTADVLEVRQVSAASAMIAGASLDAAGPLLGSITIAAGTGRYNILLDIASMTRGATVILLLHSQKQRLGTAPTVNGQITITSITGTAAQRPYMDFPGSVQFVGLSSVVEGTGTTLTLTEPAGVADGDLLIACIASRTTATTAPSNTGWTEVGSQKTNNTLTNSTSAIASATMLYQMRAGTPDLIFDIPAGISVAQGNIIAYRGLMPAPLDAATAVTTAVNTTTVSVAGVTTTADDDLIIAMCAGGQEATWLGFNNLTSGLGASTDTDTVNQSVAAWTERVDTNTVTGADVSIGIFDAIRPTAGATGNLSVTASLGAGHAVVAGAFKRLNNVPSTLSPFDKKPTGVSLSNGNRTMSGSDASNNWVRSTLPVTGKKYVEITTTTVANTVIGIADLSTLTFPGANAKSFGMFSSGTGSINATFPAWGPTYASGNVLCMAVDLTAKKVWFRVGAGAWNAGGSADPATGVGGWDISAYTGTVHYLVVSGDTGVANTVNFGAATAFAQAVPSGFTAWDVYPNVSVSITASAALTITGGDETVTTTTGVLVSVSALALGMRILGAETGAPAYSSSQSVAYGTRTNTSLNLPGTFAAPFQVALIAVGAVGTPVAVTPPAGWTQLFAPTEIDDGSINRRLYGWYRFWQEGDASPVTFSHASSSSIGSIHAYSNVSGATPVDVQSTNSGTGAISTALSVTTVKHPQERLLFVGQDWSTSAGGRAPPTIGGASDIMAGLSWVAGAVTTLSFPSGRARCTATAPATNNPRITKTVTGLSIGQQYRVSGGKVYNNLGGVSCYVRVANDVLADGSSGPYSQAHVDAQDVDFTFTATQTTHYFALVPVCDIIGEYSEIEDGVTMIATSGDTTMTERFDAITYLADIASTIIGATGDATMANSGSPWQTKLIALTPSGATVDLGGGGTSVSVIISAVPGMTMTLGNESVRIDSSTTITAVPAMTMTLGDESVNLGTSITIAGVPGLTITCGDEGSEGDANVTVTMPALAITCGDAIAGVPTPVNVTGEQLTVSVGDVTVSIPVQVFASGNFMLASVGNAQFVASIEAFPLAMNALTISQGDESIITKVNVQPITGMQLAISVGDESVTAKANVTLTTPPALTITAGTVSSGTTTLVNVTGMEMTVSTANPGAISVNYGIRVIVTGFQLNCLIGSQVYVPQASGPIQREGMMKTMANMMGN